MQEPRVSEWSPVTEEALRDPQEAQARMRASSPVAWSDSLGGFWAIFRYDDIVEVAMNTEAFSVSGHPRLGDEPSPPLEVDRPEHTAYRRVLQPYFTRQRAETHEVMIRDLAAKMLSSLIARGSGDMATEFTYPFPARVLCRILSIPDGDWEPLKRWADQFYRAGPERDNDPAAKAAANRRLLQYGEQLIESRRAGAFDPDTDLVARLVGTEIDGCPLPAHRILGIIRLLITAGHNSTTSALGNALVRLASDHELQRLLRENPDLIPRAVDEMVRIDTPVMTTPRYLARDTDFRGCPMRRGDSVAVVWSSGNRDSEHYSEPENFDPERDASDHLAFGRGIHKCLGMFVALLELRVVIEEILRLTSGFELAGPVTRTSWERYGVSSLPMAFQIAPELQDGRRSGAATGLI